MTNIILYNTLTKKIGLLSPHKKCFKMYCCGPTVYGSMHIGNFRTFIYQDILRRVLSFFDYNPKHVRNITDIDDKCLYFANKARKCLYKFTNQFILKFWEDCRVLNILKPHLEPKATKFIYEQILLIKKLFNKGLAYIGKDRSVYFNINLYKQYYIFSEKSRNLNPVSLQRKNFVLWKKSTSNNPQNIWKSPWGIGRPGWHIECSSMILSILGCPIDLHSGGLDLVFPHHENEVAQVSGSLGLPLSKIWFHIGSLRINGMKMSKSLKNIYSLKNIFSLGYTGLELRYYLIEKVLYNKSLNFSENDLLISKKNYIRVYKFLLKLIDLYGDDLLIDHRILIDKEIKWFFFKKGYINIIKNLNIPIAIASILSHINIYKYILYSNTDKFCLLKELSTILNLLGLNPRWIHQKREKSIKKYIILLGKLRWITKYKKRFLLADHLRLEIIRYGYTIKDYYFKYTINKL